MQMAATTSLQICLHKLLRTHPLTAPPSHKFITQNMSYEIVTLDEMIWDGEKQHFFYECPCGDVFTLTPDDVRAGEEIARCASCSLYIEVEYDSSQAEELLKELCV